MTTERIDVLAVMQKAEYDYLEDGFREAADAMGLARAAVAELIEAIKQYQSDYTDDGCLDENCVLCRRSQVADDRLRAALARVGGAP